MKELKDKVYESLIYDAEDDYVGLWQVPAWVGDYLVLKDPQAIMEISLSIVERLLKEGGLLPGNFKDKKYFTLWTIEADEAIERIRIEWLELEYSEPAPGDIVWFVSPKYLSEVEKYQKSLNEKDEGNDTNTNINS